MKAGSGIAIGVEWTTAVTESLDIALAEFGESNVDMAFVFASWAWAEHYPELLAAIRQRVSPRSLVGCSGQAIIGLGREIEGEAAVAVVLLSLPDTIVRTSYVSESTVGGLELPADWHRRMGVEPMDVNGLVVLADPFHLDIERLLGSLSAAFPARPIVGGLASGLPQSGSTQVFLDDQVYQEGAVIISFGGSVALHPVVSQGCRPIGQTWTVTAAEGNVLEQIGGKPALDVLLETFRTLNVGDQQRARGNMMVGLVVDEYRSEYGLGDFLVRNLLGIDPDKKSIAVGAELRVGQTIQFQLRDAIAADEDLREQLSATRAKLGESKPTAALLFSCNGRGRDLFTVPNHDAAALAELIAPMPTAGFFCNGEIGPVGNRSFLHGFTASLALLVPTVA